MTTPPRSFFSEATRCRVPCPRVIPCVHVTAKRTRRASGIFPPVWQVGPPDWATGISFPFADGLDHSAEAAAAVSSVSEALSGRGHPSARTVDDIFTLVQLALDGRCVEDTRRRGTRVEGKARRGSPPPHPPIFPLRGAGMACLPEPYSERGSLEPETHGLLIEVVRARHGPSAPWPPIIHLKGGTG